MNRPRDETTEPLEPADGERERVFELYEAKIPAKCERCTKYRPRSLLLKKMLGSQQSFSFICRKCSAVIRRQGAEVARRIQETLEAQGVDVER